MPTREEIARLAENLQAAGVVNLDRPLKEVLAAPAAISSLDPGGDVAWEALLGSTYFLVRPGLEAGNVVSRV